MYRRKNVLLTVTASILAAALVAVSVFAVVQYRENKRLSKQTAALKKAQGEIDDYTAQIEEIEQQLKQYEGAAKKAEELQAQLDAANAALQKAQQEKNELQQKNSSLQAQLTAKRAAEQAELKRLAIQNSQQSPAPQNAKICYLTFDDGPSDNTLRILDILAGFNIKATFFVTATGKTQYISRIDNEGHAIGLHSATHNYASIYQNPEAFLADLQRVSDVVTSITGKRSMMMRFPGGSSNQVSRRYCSGIMSDLTLRLPAMGYSYYDWNVSSGDATSARPSAQYIINSTLSGARGKQSICVLMHDTAAKTTTVDALPAIIAGLYDMGYRFEPLNPTVYGFHQNVIN